MAARTKDTYFFAQYKRLVRHIGKKGAIIAVGHSILTIVYNVMKNCVPYKELGEDFFDKLNFSRLKSYYIKRFESLAYDVKLSESSKVA